MTEAGRLCQGQEFRNDFVCHVLNCPPTDLLVDHVTHGHSDLHACSLDMEEVEVME